MRRIQEPEHPGFEWDEANLRHIAEHGVTHEEAEQALLNDPLDVAFEVIDGEERSLSVGPTNQFRILLVVWTFRQGRIRVVTAYNANRQFQRAYLSERGL